MMDDCLYYDYHITSTLLLIVYMYDVSLVINEWGVMDVREYNNNSYIYNLRSFMLFIYHVII